MQTQEFIFTEWVRAQIRDRMGELGRTLHRLGVHPDMITLLGLVIVAIASVIIARGQFQLGGIILVLGLPLDALDGAVARAMGRKGNFGGVLDSTLDRYADAFILQLELMIVAWSTLVGGLTGFFGWLARTTSAAPSANPPTSAP